MARHMHTTKSKHKVVVETKKIKTTPKKTKTTKK